MSLAIKILLTALLVVDISGVQLRGVPVALAILGITIACFAILKRRSLRDPSWLQGPLLFSLSLGLVALPGGSTGVPPVFATGGTPVLLAGVRELAQWVAVIGFGWLLFASTDESERRWLRTALAAICIVGIIWGIAGRITGLSALLSHARVGLILALTFPFLVHRLLDQPEPRKHLAVAAACVLLFIASRNGGLLVCGLLAAAVVIVLRERKTAWQVLLVAAAPVAVAIVTMGPSPWETLVMRHAGTGNLKRLYLEYEALPNAVRAAPVAGHGLGRYKDVIHGYFVHFPDPTDNKVVTDTNSSYALMAVESGPIPVAIFILMIAGAAGMAGVAAIRDRRLSPEAAAAVALLAAGLFTNLVTRNTGMATACVLGMASAAGGRSTIGRVGWLSRMACLGLFVGVLMVAAQGNFAAVKPAAEAPATADGPAEGPDIVGSAKAAAPANACVIEAEDTVGQPEPAMKISGANDVSGNKVLEIPLEAGKGKGQAAYRTTELPAGAYMIWVRALWTDGCSNSIGCVIGGKEIIIADELFGKWHWVCSAVPVDLPAGTSEFCLKNTEDGIMIDQIILTTDKRFVPHGIMRK